jgi:crossover junction endodeoxyribonuclease RusA
MSIIVLDFTVPGEPARKERPRSRVMAGKVITYTPPETKKAEERIVQYVAEALTHDRSWVSEAAKQAVQGDPYACFKLTCIFYVSRIGKRDVDNMLKLVMDAINHTGGRVWVDDRQVTDTEASVRLDAENPRTVAWVSVLDDARLPEPKRARKKAA